MIEEILAFFNETLLSQPKSDMSKILLSLLVLYFFPWKSSLSKCKSETAFDISSVCCPNMYSSHRYIIIIYILSPWPLTHWGRVTHICVSNLTIIDSDNGLSPGRYQAIIWTNAGILLIRTLETNFSEILCEIHTSSFTKKHLKVSSAKWRPFCFGLSG